MTIKVAIARAGANTVTGNQDFTTADLGGDTPKAALFIVTRGLTTGVATVETALSIGAATATTQRWYCYTQSQDGQAATTLVRRADDATGCLAVSGANGGLDGEAAFDSFIADGVRVNWTNAPVSADLVTVILFAGAKLSAYAGTFAPGTTIDATVDITAPNFQPDLVILAGHGSVFSAASTNFYAPAFGFAVRDGSNTQRCILHNEGPGLADGDPRAYLSTAYGIGQHADGATGVAWGGEIGDFDSQGFSCTLRVASASTDEVGYLALGFGGGASVWAGTLDTPTSTGNQGYTGPGFRPQAVLLGLTQVESVDATDATANGGPYGIGVFTPTAAFSNAIAIQDAAATTNTQCLSSAAAAELPDDDGTAGVDASFVSMDTAGWTLDFTAVKAAAKKWIALAISVPSYIPGDAQRVKSNPSYRM